MLTINASTVKINVTRQKCLSKMAKGNFPNNNHNL